MSGASCRYLHAVNVRVAQQVCATQCPHGVAEAAVVAGNPFQERGFVPGRRESGIEENLVVAESLEFVLVQQYGVFVQAAAHDFALGQQLVEGTAG